MDNEHVYMYYRWVGFAFKRLTRNPACLFWNGKAEQERTFMWDKIPTLKDYEDLGLFDKD